MNSAAYRAAAQGRSRSITCKLVVVYENDISDALGVGNQEHDFAGCSVVFDPILHPIGFSPHQLKDGVFCWRNTECFNSSSGNGSTSNSTSTKSMLDTAANKLIQHVLTKENLGLNVDYKSTRYPPVIFVGLGFGALVVMKAMLQTKATIPMGAVVSSVSQDGATAKSPQFKSWYANLVKNGNGDMEALTGLLDDFNRHCHKEHIRLSCITRDMDEEHGFIAQHLRCARHSREDELLLSKVQPDPAEFRPHWAANTGSWSRMLILKSHIKRSWPEVLLQLTVGQGAADQDSDTDEYLAGNFDIDHRPSIIKEHLGKHAHEPTMVRVLQEASRRHDVDIVTLLLDDNVHPDSRVTRHEATAFELAGEGAKGDPDGTQRTRLELFKYGAKVNMTNSSYPWTFWHGFDGAARKLGEKVKDPRCDEGVEELKGTHLRALVVDIYSRPSRQAPPGQDTETTDEGKQKKSTDKINTEKQRHADGSHEFHQVAHPTIEELIYTKGPSAILNSTPPDFPPGLKAEHYDRFRWIHLPMNHMTWVRDLVEMICVEHCPDHYRQRSAYYVNNNNPGEEAARSRRGSLATCSDECGLEHGEESRFPCNPKCADSIFEARYWLGQQDTPGTGEHSTIRCLRPQFRRLGLVDSKRTGFAVVLPYVHFERHDKVQKLKRLSAELERDKTVSGGSYCATPFAKHHHHGPESKEAGSGSDDDDSSLGEWDTEEEEVPPPPGKRGPTRRSSGTSDSSARSTTSTMQIIQEDTYNTLPVHYRRTLSQFYYHSRLQSSKQVATRYFKRTWPQYHPLTLMVDQLWMLVLVDGTIITAFPSQMDGVQHEFPYLYTDVVEELLMHLRSQWRPPVESVLDLGFMAIQKAIGFLFNQRALHDKRFRFLNIYEQQLSEMAADEATWFRDLSSAVRQLPQPDDQGYEDAAQECLRTLLGLDAEADVMRKMKRLKQIRRELNVLLEVVRVQDAVIAQMTEALESREFRTGDGHDAFRSTEDLKDRRRRRAKKLGTRRSALEILDQKAIGVMNELDLFINRKEQHVRNLQSYFSGRLADQSAHLSKVVLILTILTSIFAPLSFFAAFMALGITEMPRNDGDISMPLWFAVAWIFGLGSIVISIILYITFRKPINRFFRNCYLELNENPPKGGPGGGDGGIRTATDRPGGSGISGGGMGEGYQTQRKSYKNEDEEKGQVVTITEVNTP